MNEFNKGSPHKCRKCNAEYCRQWKRNNRKRYNEYHRNYRATNTGNKIKHALRTRMSNLIKTQNSRRKVSGNYPSHTLLHNLGCDYDFFIRWIAYQASSEMTFENYGVYWHIDHVLPVRAFNHENEEEVKVCWNWINLRPLEAEENLRKSDKIDKDLYSKQLLLGKKFLEEYERLLGSKND